jgi:hypothetical protein
VPGIDGGETSTKAFQSKKHETLLLSRLTEVRATALSPAIAGMARQIQRLRRFLGWSKALDRRRMPEATPGRTSGRERKIPERKACSKQHKESLWQSRSRSPVRRPSAPEPAMMNDRGMEQAGPRALPTAARSSQPLRKPSPRRGLPRHSAISPRRPRPASNSAWSERRGRRRRDRRRGPAPW